MKHILSSKKYQKPHIKTSTLKLNLFTPFEWDEGTLLACSCACSTCSCSGGDCPSGCSCSCFLAGTMVKTPDGERKIESIKEGDKVISYDETTDKYYESIVEKTFIHTDIKKYLVINKIIRVTPEHRFWECKKKMWLRAGELAEMDVLFGYKEKEIPVTSIEVKHSDLSVYNIHIEHDPHTYFAQGVLVHNWK